MTKQQEPCKEKGAFRGANFGVAVAPLQGGAIRAFFSRPVRPKIDPSDANCYQIGSTGIPVE